MLMTKTMIISPITHVCFVDILPLCLKTRTQSSDQQQTLNLCFKHKPIYLFYPLNCTKTTSPFTILVYIFFIFVRNELPTQLHLQCLQ